jgi:RNA recognition motif-containing protein
MNIYVGNLSPEVTEDDLRSAFEAYGQVTSVKVIKDKFTGEPRGFGFIEMPGKQEAKSAMDGLNTTELKGKSIIVNEARERTDKRRGGSGGSGRRRSGGGGVWQNRY